jgi:hypothetical protein
MTIHNFEFKQNRTNLMCTESVLRPITYFLKKKSALLSLPTPLPLPQLLLTVLPLKLLLLLLLFLV